MYQNKSYNIISKKKWGTFDLKTKKKVLFNYFLEIEKIIQLQMTVTDDRGFEELQMTVTDDRGFEELQMTDTDDRVSSTPSRKLATPSILKGIITTPLDQSYLNIIKERFETILSQFDLLKDETDETLKAIYSAVSSFSINPPTPLMKGGFLLALYNTLRPFFNEDLIEQKDFHFLYQNPVINKQHKMNTILILDNLRSAFNVGSIIRTAECINLQSIYFGGYTPLPTHPKVKNTAMGTESKITWSQFAETKNAILEAKKNEFTVIALETVPNVISIYEYNFPEKTALIVGNEALGISKEVLDICDAFVTIPISGWKSSLNVATATAVACFEIYRSGRR